MHRLIVASLLLGLVWPAGFAPRASAAEPGPGSPSQFVYDPKTREWIEVAPPEPGTDAGDLELARRLLAEHRYGEARKALRAWRKSYPDSPLYAEALFASADAEVYAADAGRAADLWQAHEWYDEILNGWGGTDVAERAIRRELIVAEMFLFKGHKRRVLKGMLRVSAVDETLDFLNRIIDDRAPGTRVAEQALRMQADYHFQKGEFDEAERAYARLARDFPRGEYERLALQRAADAAFASFAGIEFDDAPLLEAEERYHQYLQRYPGTDEARGVPELLERIRENRAEKELTIGRYYERAKQPSAAIYYYRSVATNWPDTIAAEQARNRLEQLGESVEHPPQVEEPTAATPESSAAPAAEAAPPR